MAGDGRRKKFSTFIEGIISADMVLFLRLHRFYSMQSTPTVDAAFAKSSSPAGKGAHSQLAERQQNSRLRRSNIAAVSPLALLPSLLLAAAPAEIAPAASAGRVDNEDVRFPRLCHADFIPKSPRKQLYWDEISACHPICRSHTSSTWKYFKLFHPASRLGYSSRMKRQCCRGLIAQKIHFISSRAITLTGFHPVELTYGGVIG